MNEGTFMQIFNYPEKYMLQAGGEYELISEMSFLRSIIKYKKCKVIIYGAGKRCEYLVRWLNMEKIQVEFIIDSNPCKHNDKINNIVIYHIDSIPEKLKGRNYLVLVSTVYYETETNDIMFALFRNGMKNILYPFAKEYGLAPYRYDWVYYYMHHKDEILQVFRECGDDKSREILYEYIKAIVTNCVYRGGA